MKKALIALFAALGLLGFAASAQANSAGVVLDKAPNHSNDLVALQHGAKLFVNYCLNCHSATFMRYNRLTDLGLSEKEIKDTMLFATEKVGDTMVASIDPRQAKEWFGGNPPDLSLIARSRAGAGGSGADYLYTYLRTYYPDPTKPTGWNNLAFPNVGMPHVLWELQGKRIPIMEVLTEHEEAKAGTEGEKAKEGEKSKEGEHKAPHEVFTGRWEQITPGTMTPAEYDAAVGDLVAYLQWMGEPAQNTRLRIGVWVLLFLLVLTFITWRLNAAYWKDVK